MSVGPRLGKISESEFQSAEMPVGSGRSEGGRESKEQRAKRVSESFISIRNVYWGELGYSGHILQCWVESWEI